MKKVILDESILDIDKWLPQEAIDQIVEIILQIENNRELRNEMVTLQNITEFKQVYRKHIILTLNVLLVLQQFHLWNKPLSK